MGPGIGKGPPWDRNGAILWRAFFHGAPPCAGGTSRDRARQFSLQPGGNSELSPWHRQAWNLARSLADFVADGCRPSARTSTQQRLAICDTCDQRRGNRCLVCGCRLALKARGRAFQCPLAKWPVLPDDEPPER